MSFKDHFSKQSKIYSSSRPRYPKELFEFLRTLPPSRELVWDCATGNGQAAVSLAEHFDKVIATDASQQQIDNAFEMENVEYLVAPAEEIYFRDGTVDMVTVATALHWFDHPRFFAEVQRVLKPGGVMATWSYAETRISDDIDMVMDYFAKEYLLDYWAPEAKINWVDRYESIELPFEKINAPGFQMSVDWDLEQFVSYLHSWSAVQAHLEQSRFDPVEIVFPDLLEMWGGDIRTVKTVKWDMIFKAGRKN
ncbi:MAG TPA: methyltransferase domain-containing protein [Ignavibacteria bacterium]|nr:methyltransferase domain-containing protein [Ignavibacteria bacterium]